MISIDLPFRNEPHLSTYIYLSAAHFRLSNYYLSSSRGCFVQAVWVSALLAISRTILWINYVGFRFHVHVTLGMILWVGLAMRRPYTYVQEIAKQGVSFGRMNYQNVLPHFILEINQYACA